MLPGETIASGANPVCEDCGPVRGPDVMMSGAGYYIGYECNCGPYSRETGYFRTRADAEKALRAYIGGRDEEATTRR